MEVLVPLKLKYRNPDSRRLRRTGVDPVDGTLVFKAGRFGGKNNNSGKVVKAKQGLGPRRRAYNTHYTP